MRRDVCEAYGGDLWCPGVGPASVVDLAGGICCLDADQDGKLEWVLDEAGIPDDPLNVCAGSACAPR
jgi:hypothetical protein